jgi:hypothetical protein
VGTGGFDGFRQKQDVHESLPRYLAMVENETCASLCVGDMRSVRDQIVYLLLGRPSSPLYGGRGLGIWSKSVTGVRKP